MLLYKRLGIEMPLFALITYLIAIRLHIGNEEFFKDIIYAQHNIK